MSYRTQFLSFNCDWNANIVQENVFLGGGGIPHLRMIPHNRNSGESSVLPSDSDRGKKKPRLTEL